MILAGERFEGGVLGSEATIGGDIDDEEGFACVRFEGSGLAVDVAEGDIVERRIFSEGDKRYVGLRLEWRFGIVDGRIFSVGDDGHKKE